MTQTPLPLLACCRWAACLSTLLLAFAWGAQALANGRPANTTSVVIHPTNPQKVFVGTTFGPIISQDCGATFTWVCEGAVIPGGFAQADYSFFWGAGDAMLIQGTSASGYGGVARSTDGGCNWTSAGEFNQLNSTNLAGDPRDANVIYVTATDVPHNLGYVYRSGDAGATYQQLPLSRDKVYWYSVQASAYTPQVLVAAGFDSDIVGPYVATSRDAGNTWSIVLTQVGDGNQLDIPQVILHPTDPNLMFIAVGDASSGNASTLLLRSTDGGATGTRVAAGSTLFRGVQFANDGNHMWFSTQNKIFYSQDAGLTFTPLAAPAYNACVSYNNDTLYACGNDPSDHFSIAASRDDGQSWHAGFSLAALTQATCDANSASTMLCTGSGAGQWGYYAPSIGADGMGQFSASEPNYVALSSFCGAACVNEGNCIPTSQALASPSKSGCHCDSASGGSGLLWMACIGAAWAMAARHRRVMRKAEPAAKARS